MKQILTIIIAALALTSASQGPGELRCEGLINPLGIDNAAPHFSWKSSEDAVQSAYEIQVASSAKALKKGEADIWDSGKVESEESVMVPYEGKKLEARQICYWRVKTYDNDGNASEWSKTQGFSIGPVDGLKGEFITFGSNNIEPLFRKTFSLKKRSRNTMLHICSLGYHEIYINGIKVGRAIMNPAVSQLSRRALINTYDISPYLRKGKNELIVWAAPGWFKKDTFNAPVDAPAIKAEMSIDGETFLVTDNSWLATESGCRDRGTWLPGQFYGEEMDATKMPANFRSKALDKLSWSPAETLDLQGIELSCQMCRENIAKEYVTPVSIEKFDENTWVVDMGKVLNGLFSIKIKGLEKGRKVEATYCDYIDKDGKPEIPFPETDVYICSGKNDRFCNRFSPHAYRYVFLKGLDKKPEAKDIKGIMMGTDMPSISSFECSDGDINRIHDMIHYTAECLTFNGYMVDCPHIEKGGYGGDGNSSTMTLQTMFDVNDVYYNWMQAWRDCQQEDGGLPHTAPEPYKAGGGPYWCSFIIAAPYRSYLNYGDTRMIEQGYESMLKWLGYVDAYTVDGLLKRWPDTDYRNWYLGDWLAPDGIVDYKDPVSADLVSNCAVSRSLKAMEEIASLLGKPDDAEKFKARREELNSLIHNTFFNEKDTTYASGSQIDLAYPVIAGVVPCELKEAVSDKLVSLTESLYKNHLATGLVGIPILTEWAVKEEKVDFMYEMLSKKDYPGYLYMIENGATATWESWEGTRSRVHNCYNGIGTWFYQALGGITSEAPGYREVRIKPQIPKAMQWAKVCQDTPYGKISCNWKKNADNTVNVAVSFPACTKVHIWNGSDWDTIKGSTSYTTTYNL